MAQSVGLNEAAYDNLEEIIEMSRNQGNHLNKSMAVAAALALYRKSLITQHKATEFAIESFGIASLDVLNSPKEDRG